MPWEFTEDVNHFAQRAMDLLLADPVETTLPASIVDSVRRGRRYSEHSPLFGWFDDQGMVRGAVCMTPPYEMVLAVVPDETIAPLAAALRQQLPELPGVHGTPATVERFVREFQADRVRVIMRNRLYALGTLQPPASQASGAPRPAVADDLSLLQA
ncbi:MAG: hypothetical protein JXA67_00325 [Micromonosporaceae bacterium]|nr:hypothetical protein [Micromonosporaceae bacterium]